MALPGQCIAKAAGVPASAATFKRGTAIGAAGFECWSVSTYSVKQPCLYKDCH